MQIPNDVLRVVQAGGGKRDQSAGSVGEGATHVAWQVATRPILNVCWNKLANRSRRIPYQVEVEKAFH
jgi:hypothetical protein